MTVPTAPSTYPSAYASEDQLTAAQLSDCELEEYLEKLSQRPAPTRVVVVMDESLLRCGIVSVLAPLSPHVSVTASDLASYHPVTSDLVVTLAHLAPALSRCECVVISLGATRHATHALDSTCSPDQLLVAVREIFSDALPASPLLSRREREIISLAARGMSTNEIAAQCFISPDTVKTHLSRIYKKLGAVDRAGAVFTATTAGLISSTL